MDANKAHAIASQLNNDMFFHKLSDALLRTCSEVHSGDREEGKKIVSAFFEALSDRRICLVREEDFANLHKSLSHYRRNRDMWKGQVDRQSAKIGGMRVALKPFSDEAENWEDFDQSVPVLDTLGLTVGHLRKAREASR